MKSISFIGLFILALISNSLAQTKTETVKVLGNCSMCKQRIEKAAAVPGVIKASWDVKSKLFTANYERQKVSFRTIQEKIAASGHDTELVKAKDLAYNNLPGCCMYERSPNPETKAGGPIQQHH